MLISTTPYIGNLIPDRHLGVVTGEAILGANLFRDWFASFRDVFGGRTKGYEKELQSARKIAFNQMTQQAIALGANAIVGVDIDYEILGKKGSMMMVSVAGTAVFVE